MQAETFKPNLIAYKQKNRFSPNAWENRGLVAPNIDLCKEMQLAVNEIIDRLLVVIDQHPTTNQLKKIIKDGLNKFDKNGFDTEEKEFIGDVFFELSNIVGVNILSDINKWHYGALISALMKLAKSKTEKKIIETLKQPCVNCGIELETHVTEYEEDIPDIEWIIAKCNNCKGINLLSTGPNVKGIRIGNYELLGNLSKEDYNYQQALEKVKQMKYPR